MEVNKSPCHWEPGRLSYRPLQLRKCHFKHRRNRSLQISLYMKTSTLSELKPKIRYCRHINLKQWNAADVWLCWQPGSVPADSAAISRSSLSSASAWTASWALRCWKNKQGIFFVIMTKLQTRGQSHYAHKPICTQRESKNKSNLFQRLYWSKIFWPPVKNSLIGLIFFLCNSLLFLLFLFLFVAIFLSLLKDTSVIHCRFVFFFFLNS